MRSTRHTIRLLLAMIVIVIGAYQSTELRANVNDDAPVVSSRPINNSPAASYLSQLTIKGRAPKTGYTRAAFSGSWGVIMGCDVRNFILARDLTDVIFVPNSCKVASGRLADPYTAAIIMFLRGPETSDDIQIDHVVALSDAWQKGAQSLTSIERYALANDPLNLLAVQGDANQAKGDSDAATWLPPNKSYRCLYIARQIAVKTKYSLWVTRSEHDAMAKVLSDCPEQTMPE